MAKSHLWTDYDNKVIVKALVQRTLTWMKSLCPPRSGKIIYGLGRLVNRLALLIPHISFRRFIMLHTIQADFYRLFRSKGFWITEAILVLNILSGTLGYTSASIRNPNYPKQQSLDGL